MRTIFAIIAVFSLCGIRAQGYTPSYGRELPRGTTLSYPTQELAAAASGGNNAYFTRLGDWKHEGNVFSLSFTVPFAWANRQVLLHLDSASSDYEVRINGRPVAYNSNGNHPADFNITRTAKEGRNELEIVLRTPSPVAALESWKENPAPALGAAWVTSQPTLRVRDVLTKTWRSDDEADFTVEVAFVVKSDALNPRTSRIYYELLSPAGRTTAVGHDDATLKMRSEDTIRFVTHLPADSLWSAEKPHRYTLRVKTQRDGRFEEYQEYRLGFRSVATENGQLLINGAPVTLKMREVSPSMINDEIIALKEQDYNALKLLPGAVQPSLYGFCDEIGLYVIPQAPIDTRRSGESRRRGGNPTNDPAWTAAYLERTADSYHTSKRHASVVAFLLAQKSANGINLYESYLSLKQQPENRPFIYPDAAGEWNTDRFEMKFEREK